MSSVNRLGVAQFGRVRALEACGRWFESSPPDLFTLCPARLIGNAMGFKPP